MARNVSGTRGLPRPLVVGIHFVYASRPQLSSMRPRGNSNRYVPTRPSSEVVLDDGFTCAVERDSLWWSGTGTEEGLHSGPSLSLEGSHRGGVSRILTEGVFFQPLGECANEVHLARSHVRAIGDHPAPPRRVLAGIARSSRLLAAFKKLPAHGNRRYQHGRLRGHILVTNAPPHASISSMATDGIPLFTRVGTPLHPPAATVNRRVVGSSPTRGAWRIA